MIGTQTGSSAKTVSTLNLCAIPPARSSKNPKNPPWKQSRSQLQITLKHDRNKTISAKGSGEEAQWVRVLALLVGGPEFKYTAHTKRQSRAANVFNPSSGVWRQVMLINQLSYLIFGFAE